MKLRYIGQAVWAGAVSLGIVFGVAACGQDNTIDYVFVANAKNNPGEINVYLVDSISGGLKQILESPYPSGGRNPQSIAATSNGKYLYVANHDDNTIVQFAIGTDAKLYPEHTYQTPGSFPTALTIDSTDTYVFVTDAFQPQYSPSTPGPGALVIYPICSTSTSVPGCDAGVTDGSLGKPLAFTAANGATTSFYPTCNNPIALFVAQNSSAVYVVDDPGNQPPRIADTVASSAVGANGTSTIDYGSSTANGCSATTGQITSYTLTYASGTLNSVNAVTGAPVAAGTSPNAIIGDTSSKYVYVTDQANNQVLAFTATASGGLVPISGSFPTGSNPDALTIDPSTDTYLYVANYGDNSISGFQIGSNGGLTPLPSGTYATKTGPTFVYIEPNAGHYLYSTAFLDNVVSGLNINLTSGALNGVQNTPITTNGQPTSITATTHGKHGTVLARY